MYAKKAGKERQSNFELLRIVLMITIPVYHLMLYNGVFYMDYHQNVAPGLFLSSGGAITADYAFIAMTSYFLLETKNKPVIRGFLIFAAQVVTMYLIRFVVIRGLWGFHTGSWFIEDYIMGGAWWFVIPYMILLLTYPLWNMIYEAISVRMHGLLCVLLGTWFVINSITLQMNLVNDLVAFLFTYTVMAFLRRYDYRRWILKTKKGQMLFLYILGFLLTFLASWYVKYPGVLASQEAANEIVKHLIGKYAPLQFVMGLAVFFLFRGLSIRQSKFINALARSVFFVFLLHETVMGVYWYFGRINGQYPYYTTTSFWLWLVIYVGSCLIVGVVVQQIYDRFLAPLWLRLIDWVCDRPWIECIEERIWREKDM